MKTRILLSIIFSLACLLQVNAKRDDLVSHFTNDVKNNNDFSDIKAYNTELIYKVAPVEKSFEPGLEIEPWMVAGFIQNKETSYANDSDLVVEKWMVDSFRFINSYQEPPLEIEDWMTDFSKD